MGVKWPLSKENGSTGRRLSNESRAEVSQLFCYDKAVLIITVGKVEIGQRQPSLPCSRTLGD